MRSKKAVTELTSFVFITLLVVVASTSAYVIAQDYLEDTLSEVDRDNMETVLKRMNFEMANMLRYQNATRSMSIDFRTGLLSFEGNNVTFQSFETINTSETFCFNGVCYYSVQGFERLGITLESGYTFFDNFSLTPGEYLLTFVNRKDEGKIEVRFR